MFGAAIVANTAADVTDLRASSWNVTIISNSTATSTGPPQTATVVTGRWCHHDLLPRDTEHAKHAKHHDGHNGDRRAHRHHDLLPRERGDINSRNGRGAHFLILGAPRDGAPTAADIFGVRAAHQHGRRQPNADREQPDGYDCKRRGDVCGGNSKSGDLYRALPGRVVY